MNDKAAVLLSLGHNSSAIYTSGHEVIGYEQERIDRVKSSSQPPLGALAEIVKHQTIPRHVPIFITHWFDKFDELQSCKYSDGLARFAVHNDSHIVTHTKEFTHHDAHAWSALSFFKHYVFKSKAPEDYFADEKIHILVVDGFGNYQEVISLYELEPNTLEPKLVERIYDYDNSLGLMYQYATNFCGMKMNQDEYKFLGYEAKVEYVLTEAEQNILEFESSALAGSFLLEFKKNLELTTNLAKAPGDTIDIEHLRRTASCWDEIFSRILLILEVDDVTSNKARIIIGRFVQLTIEKTLIKYLYYNGVKHVLLAGGVFYNVKLNNAILNQVPGGVSVVPVAGDQGASIGFYEKFVGNFNWKTLCIGKRDWDLSVFDGVKNVFTPGSEEELQELLYNKISRGEICNLVRGNMEYGPRALGHTSSLFLPTQFNADSNNSLNQRNEVMPFAPMISDTRMSDVFDSSYHRVIGSDRFMIMTYNYIYPKSVNNAGVYHKYPNRMLYTGRPQVIHRHQDKVIYELLHDLRKSAHGYLLTNTSYNYHGEPIVFSMEDILSTHTRQLENLAFSGGNLPNVNLVLWKGKE